MPPTDPAVRLARLQAVFYIATGIWPIVSIRSFEAVTGPKVDRWLVKTVGVLVAIIGSALALASRRRVFPLEVVLVAAASAGALATIDTVYVAKRRISPVYLLDAVAEVALAAGWARLWWQGMAESDGDGNRESLDGNESWDSRRSQLPG
jgi:hypothetical protein